MNEITDTLKVLRETIPAAGKKAYNLQAISAGFVNMVRLFGHGTFGYQNRILSLEQAIKLSAVLVCLDVRAQDIAKVDLRLRLRLEGDARETVPSDQHWLAGMLADQPNRWHTWYELKEMMVLHLGAVQNAYLAKTQTRTGQATSLLPILPGRLRTLVDEDNAQLVREVRRDSPWERVLFREFGDRPQDSTFRLLEDECIHVRGRLFDGVFGYSNLEAGSRSMQLSSELLDYRTRVFKNDGSLRGVFQMDNDKTLSDEAFGRLREQLGELMRGVRENGDPIVLEEGLKFAGISMKANETEVSQAFNDAVIEQARLFRIPPHKIMHFVNVKYENMETLEKSYVHDSLIPDCQRIEQRLAHELLNDRDRRRYFLEFDREAMLLTDVQNQAAIAKVMMQTSSWTLNENRRRRGDNPLPGTLGDAILVPANARLVSTKTGEVMLEAGGTNSPADNPPDAQQESVEDLSIDHGAPEVVLEEEDIDDNIVPLRAVRD